MVKIQNSLNFLQFWASTSQDGHSDSPEIQCTQLSPRKHIGLEGKRIIYSFSLSIFMLPLITSSPGPLVLFNPSALTSFTSSKLMLKGFKLHLPSHCANCCLQRGFTYLNPLSRHFHFASGGGCFFCQQVFLDKLFSFQAIN